MPELDQLLATLIAGIASGMPLFIVASGLTLIYGVMHVLNFAHGGFLMIGAFVLTSVLQNVHLTVWTLLLGVIVVAGVLALIGVVSEVAVFRRLYRSGHVISLLAAYALLLVIEGATEGIWGATPRSVDLLPALEGVVSLFGVRVALYDLVVLGLGGVIAVALWFMLQRTSYGMRVRAVATDRAMAQALGVRAKRVSLSVFVLGAVLAGIAGVVVAPLNAVSLDLAPAFVLQSFAVVIIGGLGSMSGALVAAMLLGITESALISYLPQLAGFSMYIAMALVLLLRPQGLFGRPITTGGGH